MNCYLQIVVVYFTALLIAAGAIFLRKSGADGAAREKTHGSKKKFLSFVLINLVIIAAAWMRYHIFTFLIAGAGSLIAWEISGAVQRVRGYKFIHPFYYGLTTFIVLCAIDFLTPLLLFKLIIFAVIFHLCVITFYNRAEFLMSEITLATLSIIYIPAFLGCLVALQKDDPTGFFVVFVYVVAAATDAFAEVTGELFGKTKLAPSLSPNKTVAGSIGGLAAGTITSYFIRCCLPSYSAVTVVIFGLITSAAAQLGDLIVSSWKRNLGVKDFGNILREQGGVIDRLDSVVFAAGVFYLLLTGYQILH